MIYSTLSDGVVRHVEDKWSNANWEMNITGFLKESRGCVQMLAFRLVNL